MEQVSRQGLVFWGSAVLAAVVFAALVPVLMPYERLRLVEAADRERAWLLTVFCGGVMAVLFGMAGLLSGPRLTTVRDVVEAGSVGKALEARERAVKEQGRERLRWRNFAGWLIAAGAALVGCYFALWLALG